MKFFNLGVGHTILGVITSIVSGQQMPACAGQCLEISLKAQYTCNPTNTTCVCTAQPLMKAIEDCVMSSCTVIESLAAKNLTQTMCGKPIRNLSHVTPIVSGVSGAVAIVAVIIRSFLTGGIFALDDIFAITALLSALPMGILQFFVAVDGFGKDIWTLQPEKIYRVVQLVWISETSYFAAVALTKISFLFFCLRIFPRKELRKTIYTLVAISAAFGISSIFTCLFNCTPVSFIWTHWDGEHTGTCVNFHIFAWIHAGVNIVLDIIIIGVPIPELLRLKLNTKKKIYIVMMFSIGTFTTIVSIVRLQALVTFSSSKNATFDNVPTGYWSNLEAFVGIFCVCMPALRRFLANLFPRCFGITQTGSKYEPYDVPDFPNKLSRGLPKNSAVKFTLDGTTFDGSGIIKTTETRVESRRGEDDEIQLVELDIGGSMKEGWATAESDVDATSDKSGRGTPRMVQARFPQ
ncbi:hypothetical protein BKA66DRAFT_507745 [Pyrenochaeta sp. MPI-SDFR-AT-0127]|nr:hypothetical protein BKA66DRAFT_507745 [Pyrenochaeta sp. MPI-SDFR-AT-0127]